jgi:threonine/homoserine/homoserine lactone efflux protein
MTSASAYQLVKFMGAAYMIYVGIRMLLSSRNKAGVNLNQQISPIQF